MKAQTEGWLRAASESRGNATEGGGVSTRWPRDVAALVQVSRNSRSISSSEAPQVGHEAIPPLSTSPRIERRKTWPHGQHVSARGWSGAPGTEMNESAGQTQSISRMQCRCSTNARSPLGGERVHILAEPERIGRRSSPSSAYGGRGRLLCTSKLPGVCAATRAMVLTKGCSKPTVAAVPSIPAACSSVASGLAAVASVAARVMRQLRLSPPHRFKFRQRRTSGPRQPSAKGTANSSASRTTTNVALPASAASLNPKL